MVKSRQACHFIVTEISQTAILIAKQTHGIYEHFGVCIRKFTLYGFIVR